MSATSRWKRECLSERELSACVGPGTFIPPHVIECADCRRRRAQLVADAAVLRGYTVEAPSAEALAAVRAQVLRGTHRPEQRERPALARWAAAAAVLLALGGGGAAWWNTQAVVEPTRWASIEDGAEARYQHEVVRLGDHGVVDEVVRLERGQIRVRVEHLTASQRFRVVTPDSEVEVRGTTFDVAVEDGRLAMVEVIEGLVAIRRVGQAAVWLESGDTWRGDRRPGPHAETSSRSRAATDAHDTTTSDGSSAEVGTPGPGPRTEPEPRARSGAPSSAGAAIAGARAVRVGPRTLSAGEAAGTGSLRVRSAPAAVRPTAVAPAASPDLPPSEPAAPAADEATEATEATTSSAAAVIPAVAATPEPAPDAGTVTPEIPPRGRAEPEPEPTPEPSHNTVDLEAAELHFGWGWEALRRRDYLEAARAFTKAELLAGADALAEDAAYWRAMALHDARHADLDRALQAYVTRYPSAPRWATVALLRAERLIAAGRPAEARPLLTRIAQDPDYVCARRAKDLLAELR